MSQTSEPAFTLETVTPDIAQTWLQYNIENRKLSDKIARNYAGDMLRGEWLFNGETIKFDTRGRLFDGQHRLRAIVIASVPVTLGIFRNLPAESFKTIDTGKKRGARDIFSIRGAAYAAALGAAARLLFFYTAPAWNNNKPGRFGRMTNTQLEALLNRHPDFIDVCSAAVRKPLRIRCLTHGSNMFLYYMARHVNASEAKRFTAAAARESATSGSAAARAISARLTAVDTEIAQPPPAIKLAWSINAWNCHLAQTRPGRFRRIINVLPRFNPEPKLPGV